jgi:hypothetical protein
MRQVLRLPLVAFTAVALCVATVTDAAAATSKVTFALTLRGHVPAGIGFDLGVSPGVGGSNPFCVAANDHALDDVGVPTCRTGETYTTVVTLAEGESIEFMVSLYRPTTPRILWSGTVTGDGRDHRREYTVDFDLPATDAVPSRPSTLPGAGVRPDTLAILLVAWLLGLAWSLAVRRRGLPVRS